MSDAIKSATGEIPEELSLSLEKAWIRMEELKLVSLSKSDVDERITLIEHRLDLISTIMRQMWGQFAGAGPKEMLFDARISLPNLGFMRPGGELYQKTALKFSQDISETPRRFDTFEEMIEAVAPSVEVDPRERKTHKFFTPISEEVLNSLPIAEESDLDDETLSVPETAEALGVNRSTVTRKIKANSLIGFKWATNALRIPSEQIVSKRIVPGLSQITDVFEGAHLPTWRFLTTKVYYGSDLERPIDRLRNAIDSSPNKMEKIVDEICASARAVQDGAFL